MFHMVYDTACLTPCERLLSIWPDGSRFEACAYGSLLILAPWPDDLPSFASSYERFHYLNRLAETVCAISHTTQVAVQGLRHAYSG